MCASTGFDRAPTAQVFALPAQWPGVNVFPLGPYFAVRMHGDRHELVRRVRAIATGLDPEAGVFNVATMDGMVANRMSQPRLYAVLLGTFAGVAVVLAFVGIYGVVAYTVSQRTREIGIRMALGAAPGRVLRMVLAQSLSIAAGGIVIGLVAAAGLSRSLRGLLFGVEPLDVLTFAVVTTAFVVVVEHRGLAAVATCDEDRPRDRAPRGVVCARRRSSGSASEACDPSSPAARSATLE